MAKVREVVNDALEEIIVQAEEAAIEQSEGNAGIRALNDLMLDWDQNGITLGFTVVDDMGDEVTVAPGALRGIKTNLAIELAARYDVQVSPSLFQRARQGKKTCIEIAVQQAGMVFPETLPRGSGNDYPGWSDSTFYPNQADTILTESGGSIALENDTEEV